MARAKTVLYHPAKLTPLVTAIAALLAPAQVLSATTDIKPEIETRTYGYWIRDEQAGGGLDKGMAALLKPSVAINLTGKNASSALFLQNESVWYDDSQRSHKSLDKYSWRNIFNAYDDRVSLGLSADSGYRIRDSRNGVFSDIITGTENLSKTSNYGANANFRTSQTADVNAQLGLAYNKLSSRQPELQDNFGDFDNDTLTTFLALGSAQRQSPLFWQLSANYNKTGREGNRGDFVSKRASGTAGLPLLPSLSMIVRGSYDENDNTSGYANEFRSYGVGLEYQFGLASRINVTQNWATRSVGEQQEDIDETYLAAEVFLAPTRRTSLSYSLDRRYFGRSSSLQGQYNLRFLSVRLSVREDVQTLSSFDQIIEDLGIFVCPDGAAQFTDCFRPPTNNYQLGTGESFQQLFNAELELSEELIKRRTAAMTIGYNKNRLALSVMLSRSEDEYVETERENNRNSFSVQSTWKLSKHSSLLLNSNYYDINYLTDEREDKNLSVEMGIKRKLNERSEIKAMLKRISRNSSVDSFDLTENRVWLSYTIRL